MNNLKNEEYTQYDLWVWLGKPDIYLENKWHSVRGNAKELNELEKLRKETLEEWRQRIIKQENEDEALKRADRPEKRKIFNGEKD